MALRTEERGKPRTRNAASSWKMRVVPTSSHSRSSLSPCLLAFANPMRLHALIAASVLAVPAAAVAAPCRVGVEARTLVDASRRYGEQQRPVRVILWYPAAAGRARPVTPASLAAAEWVANTDARVGAEDPASDSKPDAAGCAGWDAAPRGGRFPIVLLGSGLAGRAGFHAALAGALADAGFVVLFVSSLGPAPGTAPRFDVDTMKMLAADATRALDSFADDARVDHGRTGLVAWSAGTVVHLFVARDRPEIRAGVSLDGGLAYDYGPRLWAGLTDAPPRAMPYLHLAAGIRSPVPTDDTLLRQLGARVETATGLSHAQFIDLPPDAPAAAAEANAAVRTAVVDFLRAALAAR